MRENRKNLMLNFMVFPDRWSNSWDTLSFN